MKRAVKSPYDDRPIGEVEVADGAAVEAAIERAHRTHETRRRSPSPLHARVAILERASALLRARHEELARLICDEAGKPIGAARVEAARAVRTFAAARDAIREGGGELLELSSFASADGRLGMVRRAAVGPIAAITPFNFPLNLVAHKLAPAIAADCPVILKPSPQSPLSAFALADVLREAGLDDAMLSVVACDNETARPLIEDERIAMLTFTGSAKVGWALRARAGSKRCTLELGGNAAVVVHDDVDVARVAERIVAGAYGYAGQSCISVQRVFAQRSIHEALRAALVDRTEKLPFGDPALDETVSGPVIDDTAVRRIERVVADAVSGGATLMRPLTREHRVLAPTFLSNVPEAAEARVEELFAPLFLLDPYDTFEEALERADRGIYGLQAGVFTRDLGRVMAAWQRLEVGGVIHDDVPTFRADAMPYGGVRRSGLGREGPASAWLEMTEPRLLLLRV